MFTGKFKMLLIAIIIATALVAAMFLYFTLNKKKSFLKENGFVRTPLYPKEINLQFKVELKEDEYKFLGYYKKKIFFFGQKSNTLLSLSDSMPLYENTILKLDSVINKKLEISNVYFDTLTNKIYIFSNTDRRVYEYNLQNQKLSNIIKVLSPFTKGIKMNSNEFIFNQQYGKEIKFSFYGYSLNENTKTLESNGKQSNLVLRNMVDDGDLLKLNNENSIYISYYKNPFYLLDSNLTIVDRFKLIDTITTGPSVLFSGSNGTGTLKYTSPLRIANPNFCISNNKLFVHSLVKAENENTEELKNNNIIDVYNIKEKGKYVGTYYLPKIEEKQITDFYIVGKKVFFIYQTNLLVYEKNDTF
ncbi:MAG: hypothetical protein HEQ40_00700 [Lacibacter sp.]